MSAVTSSITILPQSDEYTLCLLLRGVITRADHQANLAAPMRERIEKNGYYNLVLIYDPDFEGYTPDGADSSFQSIKEMGLKARRIAYVNPTARKLFQTKITRNMLGGDVRNFEKDDVEKAIAWAKYGEQADN